MRWEDERYCRLYTRDTATWMLLPWQSRCLLPLVLRKMDRAGVIEVAAGEESQALALLLHVPADLVEVGLAGLIGRGVVVLDEGRLLMPNFMEAQECSQSDKVRKQVSRAKAATRKASSQIVTDGHRQSHAVTDCHKQSQSVTDGHSSSQMVTPSLAVPSRAEPLKDKDYVAEKPATLELVAQDHPATDPVERVFAKYQAAAKSPRSKLDPKRRRLIKQRLDEGFSEEDLLRALDGYAASPWHHGENDRHAKYLDLHLWFRDAAHVEAGIAMTTAPQQSFKTVAATTENTAVPEAWS